MNFSSKKILSFTIAATISALCVFTNARATYANLDSTDVTISKSDYADLRAYVNRARNELAYTLEDASNLGGQALHDRLASGIGAALEASEQNQGLVDLKHDKLLFVAVLSRSLKLDSIFMHNESLNNALVTSSTTILLAGIHLAMNYYRTSDNPRLKMTLIPSPDWARFAYNEIPFFLRITALAPSLSARHKSLLAIFNWILGDLNRSTNRRRFASIILNIARDRTLLKNHTHSLDRSLDLLKQANLKIGKVLGIKSKSVAPRSYPTANVPASSTSGKPQWTAFPLVKVPSLNEAGDVAWDSSHNQDGGGGNILITSGQAEAGVGSTLFDAAGNSSEFTQADLNARGLIAMTPIDVPLSALYGSGHLAIGVSNSGVPVYNLRLQLSGQLMVVAGGWIAFDANQYPQFKEQALRLGWGTTIPIWINGKSYVLVRAGVGVSFTHGGPYNTAWSGQHLSPMAAVLYRNAKFFLNIQYFGDISNSSWASHSISRHEVELSLSIPLGLIFPDDAIRFEGDYTYYGGHNKQPQINVFKAGGYYELQF